MKVMEHRLQEIGMILDEKVENVIDKDHVIEALKNGIHLNDYMKKTED